MKWSSEEPGEIEGNWFLLVLILLTALVIAAIAVGCLGLAVLEETVKWTLFGRC